MITVLGSWPENLSQKVAGTTFLRQPPIRLLLALTLLIQANLSYPACSNLLMPGLFNNRFASAATGYVISQHSGPMDTNTLPVKLIKYGVFIGVLDSMRATVSKLTECPIQNVYELPESMGSSVRRTVVSGLIHSYLLKYTHQIDPVMYSGLYAAADILLTGPSNTQRHGHNDTNISYNGSEINDALWQCTLAMALSVAGEAVASYFPAHRQAANLVTQLTLIYGEALAYIAYVGIKTINIQLPGL